MSQNDRPPFLYRPRHDMSTPITTMAGHPLAITESVNILTDGKDAVVKTEIGAQR